MQSEKREKDRKKIIIIRAKVTLRIRAFQVKRYSYRSLIILKCTALCKILIY